MGISGTWSRNAGGLVASLELNLRANRDIKVKIRGGKLSWSSVEEHLGYCYRGGSWQQYCRRNFSLDYSQDMSRVLRG